MQNKKIGFIGQGWIGKNYADDFEERGFEVVRYSLEEPYIQNKEKISSCDIVFVAVPTPTTKEGFSDSIVLSALSLVGKGKVAVIKSTLLPGKTKEIASDFSEIFVVHNPEFLSVATAKYDASHPTRNIIGIPQKTDAYTRVSEEVLSVLPKSQFSLVCDSTEAELIKYARNCIGYARVLMANIFYDLSQAEGVDYEKIKEAIGADPDNGPTYANALHKSGRGAGGECFIKDFAALREFYENKVEDLKGLQMLRAMEEKNVELLKSSGKDSELLKGVYGL